MVDWKLYHWWMLVWLSVYAVCVVYAVYAVDDVHDVYCVDVVSDAEAVCAVDVVYVVSVPVSSPHQSEVVNLTVRGSLSLSWE